jgi:predicted AAA+ superfamily ATPase
MCTMGSTIPRDDDLARLRRWRDTDLFKVVTGVRRCGKSTLLDAFAKELASQGVPAERIVTLTTEDLGLAPVWASAQAFHDHVAGLLPPEGRSYLFVDEIQLVDSFEVALNSLALRFDLDIYVTESNAQMLSSNLATRLSGRYVEIHLLPLSFSQFANARQQAELPGEDLSYPGLFASYLRHGGFPLVQQFIASPDTVNDYLEGVVTTVLIKDVSTRQRVANVRLLADVTRYLMHNGGNLTSLRRIADTLGSLGRKPSPSTIDSYLQGLTDAFLLYPVPRWDVRGLRFLEGPQTYYAVDTGLRNQVTGYTGQDTGHLLENLVFLQLRRQYSQVCTGASSGGEIDFVVQQGADVTYYQVAATVRPAETLARELAPLQAVRDHHPKVLLTLDPEPPISHNGIQQWYVVDWLRGQVG